MADGEKTKEQIYDEQINPLMAQIIAICKANKIDMVAGFALDDGGEDDEGLMCNTYILRGASHAEMHPKLRDAARVLAHGWLVMPGSFAMTITGGGE